MHKFLFVLAAGAIGASAASAQVPFRIARPVNGATVRETVRIVIPRTALSGVKYLALTVDGKFRAGVAVPAIRTDGKAVKTDSVYSDSVNVVFLWNTKAPVADPKNPQVLEGVEDGTHNIKLIAFGESDKRIAEETLTLTINNRGQLAMPADGIRLAYAFRVGEQSRFKQRTELEFIGERKAPPPSLNGGGLRSGYVSQGAGAPGFGGGFDGGGGFGGGSAGPSAAGFGGGSSRPSSAGFGGGGSRGSGGPPAGMFRGGGFGGMMGGMDERMGRGGGGSGMMPGGSGFGGMMGGMGGAGFVPPQASGPFSIPVQIVKATYERTIEDQPEKGVFYVRDRVKDGTIVGAAGAPSRLQDIYDFKSRYRSVLTRGRVKSYTVPSSDKPGAYVALPIIDLGGQKRRIGATWNTQAPILLEWATMDAPPMVTVNNMLETLEWQDGFKTARIKQTYDSTADVPLFGGAGKMAGARVKMVRTIWFAYNSGRVIRTETITEVDGEAPSQILSAMVPGAGGAMDGGMGGGSGGMMGSMMSGSGAPSMAGFGGGSGMGGGAMGEAADGPGFGGGSGMGMGGMQSGGEDVKVPAKFRSTTTVTYDVPAPAMKVALRKKR